MENIMVNEQVAIDTLVPGQLYTFKIKDWETPFGDVIIGQAKNRIFNQRCTFDSGGGPSLEFIEVIRESGTKHLIYIETIESISPVEATQTA